MNEGRKKLKPLIGLLMYCSSHWSDALFDGYPCVPVHVKCMDIPTPYSDHKDVHGVHAFLTCPLRDIKVRRNGSYAEAYFDTE